MKFGDNSLIHILWDQYKGEQSINYYIEKLQPKLINSCICYNAWQYYFKPNPSREQKLIHWVTEITGIIRFLNSNSIPWKGCSLPFWEDENIGVLYIKNEYLIFIFTDENGMTEIQRFPIEGTQKLN
jgi:hypothetical protein